MENTTIKTLALCSILICCQFPLQSQTTLRGRLFDAESKEPIGYVSIGIPGSSTGTVAGPDGSFELIVPADVQVAFSCIGYARRVVALRDIAAANSVDILAVLLREVVISPWKDTETSVLGMEKTGTAMSVNFAINDRMNQNLGSEIGRRFKIKKAAQLENFQFFCVGQKLRHRAVSHQCLCPERRRTGRQFVER